MTTSSYRFLMTSYRLECSYVPQPNHHTSQLPWAVLISHIWCQLSNIFCDFGLHSTVSEESPHVPIPISNVIVVPADLSNSLHEVEG